MKNSLVIEFERRVFEESYQRIFTCLALLDEKSVWEKPNTQVPSIGNLILHLCGNARQWILSGLGNHPDNRKRDEEFVVQKNIRKADLIFLMENLRVNLRDTLQSLPPTFLDQEYRIQGFNETGLSVLVHVIEHFSYHTGQITTLTKIISNKETGYYAGLNLNQLN